MDDFRDKIFLTAGDDKLIICYIDLFYEY